MEPLIRKIYVSLFVILAFGIDVVRAQTLPPPTVSSPVNLCYGVTPLPLTATGSNLKWVSPVSGSVGGVAPLTNTEYIASDVSNNKKTIITTSVPNVKITSIDYTIPSWQSVNGLQIAIYNSSNGLVGESTVTTMGGSASNTTVTNLFNCILPTPGIYYIAVKSGSGNIGSETFTSTIGSSPVSITGVTHQRRFFSNINYSYNTETSTSPTPSTAAVGSQKFYVTQTVNGITSLPAEITVNVNSTPAPTVTSPINICQGASAPALTATGSNLLWTSAVASKVGTAYEYNGNGGGLQSGNERTTFITTRSNVMISSVEFYKQQWQSMNDMELGIFDASGTLLKKAEKLNSPGSSKIEKFEVVFNYNIATPGTYSLGIVSGSGKFCYGPASYPQTESAGILKITANTFPGNIFNINFSTTTVGASSNPVPSTALAGSYDYYVTQTVNGCISPPAVVRVNIYGITSTTSSRTCLGSSAKLKATASDGYTISWYDVPSGGTAITNGVSNTGSSSEFTTPSLTANKTYYAQASKGSCTSNRVPVQAFVGGFEWNGNSGDQTSTTGNWTSCQGNQEQMSSSTVIVSVQANKPQPKLNSNLEVANLILEGNASLNLNGYTLTARSISGTGLLIGGGTSKVVLNANGNSTIRMDQSIVGTTNLLESLVINNNSATVILDNPLLIQKTLSITGSSTLNSNGNLTLLATESSNANIASLAGGGTVLGDVHVQSFMKGATLVNRSFRTISPPVHNVKSPSKGFGIASYKTWMYVTGPGGEANGFDASPNNGHTIKYYNEAAKNSQNQYLYPANATTEYIPQGKGIYFYYRGKKDNTAGNKFVKVNGNYAVPENVTMDYFGVINSGDISPAITYTNHAGEAEDNGFNLIGNPYPSVIDWESTGIVKKNIGTTIWVQAQNGNFAIYSPLATVNGGSRYLLPGQGFFIKATGANPSLKFTEGAKVVDAAPAVRLLNTRTNDLISFAGEPVRVNKTASQSVSKISLTLYKDEYSSDETVIVLNDEATKAFDEKDIVYMGEGPVTLTSITPDDKYLAINVQPEEKTQSVVKLYVTAAASGDYKLIASGISGLAGSAIFLQDTYTGSLINLQVEDEYSFSIDKSLSATYGGNRFKLLLVPPTTLPVTLASFDAVKLANGVELNWTTKSENNSDVFQVERSTDGKHFEMLGTVKAAGDAATSSDYSFTDIAPFSGKNYYRLKMLDKDNLYILSDVIPVDFSVRGIATIEVYPNPFTEVLKVSAPKNAGTLQISIYDLSGKKMLTSESAEVATTSLKSGVYVVEVRTADGGLLGSCKVKKD